MCLTSYYFGYKDIWANKLAYHSESYFHKSLFMKVVHYLYLMIVELQQPYDYCYSNSQSIENSWHIYKPYCSNID